MELVTLTILVIVCYGIYAWLQKRYSYFWDMGLPYVPPVPIFGNMAPSFFRRKHENEMMKDLYNYNPEPKYIGVFDFLTPVWLIRDPDLIKELTIKNFDNFMDRNEFFVDIHDPLFNNNLFTMRGEKWRETRNLLSPAFTSSKMKTMYELIVACAQNLTDYMSREAEDPKNIIDARDVFSRFTADVIASCAYGINVDSLKEPNNEFYIMAKKGSNFDGLTLLKIFLARASPALFNFFRMRFSDDKVAKFFKDLIKRTIELREKEGITRPDMIQLMMDARGKTSGNLDLDLTSMTAQAFVFLLGGFETSASQMCIMAQELTTNPQVQKRLQNEIDSVLAETNGKPTYESITSMQYLDAVFSESLRRHPQIEAVERCCTKSYQLPPPLPGRKAVTLKPGTLIWASTLGIQMDEKYHKNPEKFDPDRYLGKKLTLNQVDNMGFGIGPRGCIGNRFATLEIKILFFHLLAKFTLMPNHKTSKEFKYKPGTFRIMPKEGFWFSLEPRRK
ncbi:hypothetical protein QAD02_006542 [Eretmocerus hayati]|uniref:Uncharacterized protein n=1 Tax=Eretmocerus hayati TaxID=131215 RepID=A0ACC2N155_9HYME|nr:hypothetical protein QAD02_006542 [Eretmocerus hayati]